jgi:hypothetical protein
MSERRHQGSVARLAIAASAGKPLFTAPLRGAHLEMVKPCPAYCTPKVVIGTAVAKRLLDADPTVLE